MRHRWTVALVLAGAVACRSVAPGPAATPAPAAVPAPVPTPAPAATPAPLPAALRWVRESAEHRALYLQIYRQATRQVENAAADRQPGTWAVVLDADETVIDNSEYERERAAAGLQYSRESWRAWTARRAAPPLPGAAEFLARVRALGGRIAIVSNRAEAECPDTVADFQAFGLPFDVMLCRPAGASDDKNPRFEAVAHGTTPAGLPPLEVVAFVGDNIRDFPGLGQEIRNQSDAAFDPFGVRFFVLPNPLYGSWD